MTCIVGYVEQGKVYIGGDSAGVSGWDLRVRKDEKVFVKGDMVFGFTSSFRMGQILRYCLNIPKQEEGKNDFEYLCTVFMDELIKSFKDKGYAKVENNEIQGGDFLLGYKGHLYEVHSDFQVAEIQSKYASCGCGESYALGSLKILEDTDVAPEHKVLQALETAEYFSAGVSAPFTIVSI